MSERADVLVVGGGPTGLALAAQLQAMGARPWVVEQRTEPQPSRAFVVHPRSLEVLTPLGIADELVVRGDSRPQVVIRRGNRRGRISLARPDLGDTPYPFLLAIPQAEVEHVLARHLAERGIEVERNVRFVGLRRLDEGLVCTLEHGGTGREEVYVSYLAGCDGVDSGVRRQAGIAFPMRSYSPRLLLADVVLDGPLDEGVVQVILQPRGGLFMFPYREGGLWRVITHLELAEEARPEDAVLQERLESASEGTLSVRELRWARQVVLRRGQAASYRNGRVLLAGDAAHVHSPAGAQGMNTGLQDAVNLGWKLGLVTRGTPDWLLDTYERERAPVARWTRRLTDLAFLAEFGGLAPLRWTRGRLAPPLLPLVDSGRIPTPALRLVGGLLTRYRASPICEEGEPRLRGGVPAGARLPDGEVVAGGRPGRLHDHLRPPGFHVLVCDATGSGPERADIESIGEVPVTVHRLTTAVEPPGGGMVDLDGGLLRRLGVADRALYLVRPDGYVGYRCGDALLDGLLRHLDRYRGEPD